MPIPMPNDRLTALKGPYEKIVVASCYYRELTENDRQFKSPDDTWPDTLYLVLLLNKESPFFEVAYVADDGVGRWNTLESETKYNIVEAVRLYEEWGGDI